MTLPLMPKATAVWLIENTALTFEQIANFCGMHPLEIKGIADDEVSVGLVGQNPVTAGQTTLEDIKRCEENKSARLQLTEAAKKHAEAKKKKVTRYTPVARRHDKPDAIAWIIKHCPEMNDAQIAKLIGTTKNTIIAIRSRHHWNIANLRPRDPVLLGLCSQVEFDKTYERARDAVQAAKAKAAV